MLTRPTFRNLTESFEGWAYRNGFFRELALLEKKRLLEKRAGSDRVYRLTAQGRVHALGGRDPEERWGRFWDGQWRLVCFDIPTTENSQRRKLRHYLRSKGFGYLQNSVWISPDSLDDEVRRFRFAQINAESLIMFEARACGGESDADIVAAAWDFGYINQLYERHLKLLNSHPRHDLTKRVHVQSLRSWAETERISWRQAINSDPLLPGRLLPIGYLGRRAWRRRVQVLARIRRSLETFAA
jgi:phenylacetic acid degradation operon negative regulatory protein